MSFLGSLGGPWFQLVLFGTNISTKVLKVFVFSSIEQISEGYCCQFLLSSRSHSHFHQTSPLPRKSGSAHLRSRLKFQYTNTWEVLSRLSVPLGLPVSTLDTAIYPYDDKHAERLRFWVQIEDQLTVLKTDEQERREERIARWGKLW